MTSAAATDNDSDGQQLQLQQQQQQLLPQAAGGGSGSNASNGRDVSSLLQLSVLNSLFARLHKCGLEKRSLPPEFTPSCIVSILLSVKPMLSLDPWCPEVASPVVLFGDIHGEFHAMAKLVDLIGSPTSRRYLFLGDYVDRGRNSLETMLYLLLMKILSPTQVFVLRGNHEDRRVYRYFNFEDDLVRLFGLSQGQNLSSLFHNIFCYLPVCAIVNGEIFCCHGGLSPQFNHPQFAVNQRDLVQRINQLPKPLNFRKSSFVADLLWSDPLDLAGSRMPNLQATDAGLPADQWLEHRLQVVRSSGLTGAPTPVIAKGSSGQQDQKQQQQDRKQQQQDHHHHQQQQQQQIDWLPNPRGCSYVFGWGAFAAFSARYKLPWMVRGHMFVSNGCHTIFGGRCFTLFSAANYAQKYLNDGAVIAIDRASKGKKEFPGRIMRYSKKSLMQRTRRLPVDAANWPDELGGT